MRRLLRVSVLAALALLGPGLSVGACATVDLGDNFVPPDVQLSEDYFFCVVQPTVITQYRCASGMTGEAGSCHSSRSSLRLVTLAETETVACMNGTPTGPVPESYRANLQAVATTVQSDPQSSPLYRRPTRLDSHPRLIFPVSDPAAQALSDWITMGAM